VLAELKTNNDLHARHDAAFQQLKERLDKLHVSAVNNNADNDGQRRRVCFSTPSSSHSPSPRSHNWNNSRQQSPTRRREGPMHYNSDNATGAVSFTLITSVQQRMIGE